MSHFLSLGCVPGEELYQDIWQGVSEVATTPGVSVVDQLVHSVLLIYQTMNYQHLKENVYLEKLVK